MNQIWDKVQSWVERIPATRRPWIVVSILLSLVAIQATTSMARKAVTVDEMVYIAAGYYHVKTGDFQLNMTNTPLMKVITAWPLQFLGVEVTPTNGSPADWSIIDQWHYSREFMYHNVVDADLMLFVARLPVVLMVLILGVFVFRWARQLYGVGPAYFSLFLYSFCPNLLAHGRLASQDFGLAFFMFLATYYFWQYLRKPDWAALILCGVLASCAFLVKTAAIFLGPIFFTFVVLCIVLKKKVGVDRHFPMVTGKPELLWRDQLLTATFAAAVLGVIGLFMLNLGYGFQGSFQPLPFPEPFLKVVEEQHTTVKSLNTVYFNGEIHPHGLWYLTPVAFLLKVPIPMLIFALATLASLAWSWRKLECEWLMLIYVSVLLFAFTFVVESGVGLRYCISILPFLYILVGALWKMPWGKLRRVQAGAVAVLSVWYLGSSLSAYPNYLSYFNEFAGGPKNGYKMLVDANLDWGQDLKALAEYLDEKGVDKVNLGYFGSADADYYGIDYDYLPSVGLAPKNEGEKWWYEVTEPLPPIELKPGVYAISATVLASPIFLQEGFSDAYAPFRKLEPVDQVGNSILIYKIEEGLASR